jgi:hypothetical protein
MSLSICWAGSRVLASDLLPRACGAFGAHGNPLRRDERTYVRQSNARHGYNGLNASIVYLVSTKRIGKLFGDLKVRPKLMVLHNLFFLVLSVSVYLALYPDLAHRVSMGGIQGLVEDEG